MGPSTTYAGAECSPGNAADPSTEAAPPCCSVPAGGAATEPACYSLPAGGAATEPAHYSIPAGCAATKEASGEGRGSPTPLQQSYSCNRSTHPGQWKAVDQGTWCQR